MEERLDHATICVERLRAESQNLHLSNYSRSNSVQTLVQAYDDDAAQEQSNNGDESPPYRQRLVES